MGDNDKLDRYYASHEALQAARAELLAATKAAWPIGMQVISHKFYTGPIACTVAGYHEYGNDPGALTLRNNRTGKTHTAWPHFYHRGVRGVEPA